MKGRHRALGALLGSCLATQPACKSVLEFHRATPAQVREAAAAPPSTDQKQQVRLYSFDEKPFGDGYVPGRVGPSRFDMYAEDVRDHCRPPARCPLDDPTNRWELGLWHRVPDEGVILADTFLAGVLIGLPAANIVCLGGDEKCGSGGKTAVIVTDVVLGAALVIGLAALAFGFRNFRGD